MADHIDPPSVEFFMLDPDAPPPLPASDTANGSLPYRAHQFCPPVTDASGFGWYLFPPADFALRWDGQETELALLEGSEPAGWKSLAGGAEISLDGNLEQLGEIGDERREELRKTFGDHADLLLTADADPRAMNQVELVVGPIVRTSPGWATLVRSAPNLPHPGYEVLDGVIAGARSRHERPGNYKLRLRRQLRGDLGRTKASSGRKSLD